MKRLDELSSRIPTKVNSIDDYVRIAEGILRRYPQLSDWSVVVPNKPTKWLGRCNYGHKRIELSRNWLRQLPRIEAVDTILHEIAHALTPGAAHGKEWRAAAAGLGAKADTYAPATLIDSDSGTHGAGREFYSHMLVNRDNGEIWRVWHSADNVQWASGEVTNLYPTGRPQLRGKIVFYRFEDIPDALLAMLHPPSRRTSTPFLRRFVTRRGDRRLYLNGVGERFSGCFLQPREDGGMEFIVSKGIPDESDIAVIRHSLELALNAISRGENDDFDRVWEKVLLGAK